MKRFLISIVAANILGILIVAPPPVEAQYVAPKPPVASADPRDFSGMWEGGPSDISGDVVAGQEISLTPHGAERYRSLDLADAPANVCKPYGPTRGMQSEDPRLIVHSRGGDFILILFEQQTDYRIIYMDGRSHPEDILEYPQWEGDSIGRWEGNTLVVDTIGVKEGTWIDSGGFEHSDKLHLIERFEKTDPNTIRWTVTVEDPVFYTKPFTYSRNIRRANHEEVPRLIPARCDENEKEAEHAVRGVAVGGHIRHRKAPTFPDGGNR
jgi:hypothetical protein